MEKVATLRFNEASGKWEASYGGHVFLKSASKEYVTSKITQGISEKAKALGITRYEEVGVASVAGQPAEVEMDPALHFSINERFTILQDFVEMVARGTIPSSIITGEGGLGKSYTVFRALKSAGLVDVTSIVAMAEPVGGEGDDGETAPTVRVPDNGYTVVKGFSTAKGLYRTLYQNKNRIVVFDDCDSVLKDPVAANLLKAALDSYDTRMITWNSESFGDDGLPRSFEFTGGIVFISNMPMFKIPQPLISRSMAADVSMTRSEVIERMRTIVAGGEFLPEYEMEHKEDAIEFIAENAHRPQVKHVNLRTLINVTKARAAKPEHWQRLALYTLVNG